MSTIIIIKLLRLFSIYLLDWSNFFSVIHHITPWNHTEYEVLGSTATYTILLDLDAAPKVPYSCTCPSFIYAVLLSETHIMVCIILPSSWTYLMLCSYYYSPVQTLVSHISGSKTIIVYWEANGLGPPFWFIQFPFYLGWNWNWDYNRVAVARFLASRISTGQSSF